MTNITIIMKDDYYNNKFMKYAGTTLYRSEFHSNTYTFLFEHLTSKQIKNATSFKICLPPCVPKEHRHLFHRLQKKDNLIVESRGENKNRIMFITISKEYFDQNILSIEAQNKMALKEELNSKQTEEYNTKYYEYCTLKEQLFSTIENFLDELSEDPNKIDGTISIMKTMISIITAKAE